MTTVLQEITRDQILLLITSPVCIKVANSYLPVFQLLSEIAEVEESHEDNISPRNNKGPDTAPRGEPSLEPRVKRPVTRSNKRRSLSLPTGAFSFYF